MTQTISGPAYRIHTQRTVIRCWDPKDAPMAKASVDENIAHLLTFMPWAADEPQPVEQKIALLRSFRGHFDLGQDFVYGIFNRDETRVLGGTGLHTRGKPNTREIGYWIHKDFTRQGLATEVSMALTKVAFEIDHVWRVEIICAVDNIASAAVPRKLGYTCEAVHRQEIILNDGQRHDEMYWTLLESEYPTSPSASAAIEAYDALGRRIL